MSTPQHPASAVDPVPPTMRAAFIRRTGGPEEIEVGELPVPDIGPTDVLVRVTAGEVDHVDLFVRSGAYATATPFPFVIGRDAVGTVARTGAGVTGVAPGDRVWTHSLGHDGRQGAFAEYAAVPVDRLHRLPEGVDAREAVVVLHAAATAHLGLARHGRARPGETIVVHGAGGAVGSAVVQTAHAWGLRVVATCGPGAEDWCRECGADTVLRHDADGLADRLRAALPEGADLWWDTSGRNEFELSVPLLARRGRILLMSGLGGADPALPVGQLYTKDASVRGFALSNATVTDLAEGAREINRLLAAGVLRARNAVDYPLADAARAHRDMESGAAHGRIRVLI